MRSGIGIRVVQPKERGIWIYGNPDKTHLGFPMPGDLTQYLKGDIFSKGQGRYRYTQSKNADVIVLSRNGTAYGHFDIEDKVVPNEKDKAVYPNVKFVYIVRASHLYNQPVSLASLSITVRQYGSKLSENQFQELLELAGGVVEYHDIPPLPEELVAPDEYLEGAVTTLSVNSYERNRKARRACIEHHGWNCAVCGLKMADLYGELGHNMIHVHHLHDLASIGAEYMVDPIRDLRPVCPNCHVILHTRLPAMSIEQLRNVLSERKPIQWPAN